MRRPLTYLEGIWLVVFHHSLTNFNWIVLIILILFFPRWKVLFDDVYVQRAYNKKHKRSVEDIEKDIVEAIKEEKAKDK